MPMLAGHRTAAIASTLSAATAVALLSACTPNQPPATSPGTTPAIWTGSPSPSGASKAQGANEFEGAAAASESITTMLKGPDGTEIATAKFDFSNNRTTVTILTIGAGHLTPGFHGVHIHQAGKCEPNSVAPGGGAPGDFLSAGGRYRAPGRAAGPAGGDLTSLQVLQDGSAMLVTTTDAFTRDDLLAGEKTAIIIHGGADNFANIPADRYSQNNGAAGPGATTMSTGDAGKRVACGVIGSG